ncbi:hypothetical protein HCB46_00945 [Listeria ivanovii]|uniref:hypothetical protein n=1 Tax=Listeria ivanovii TaxID=1638 RepID=UPI001629902F|nr:hypothetical protein [Listeria ivanovii]MBC2254035.1 hypothetical protein [Listeria ivanovii]
MKKKWIITVATCFIFANIAPSVSLANENQEKNSKGGKMSTNSKTVNFLNSNLETSAEPIFQMVTSNQTDGGGSSYKYVSKQVVNLESIGVNLVYRALIAGGLGSVPMGKAAARAMITTGLSGLFDTYKYMRQTIYKKSDKKYYYYKVINEFSNSKTTWKGPVKTSYQKVRR